MRTSQQQWIRLVRACVYLDGDAYMHMSMLIACVITHEENLDVPRKQHAHA
jgi:hypothetical protein